MEVGVDSDYLLVHHNLIVVRLCLLGNANPLDPGRYHDLASEGGHFVPISIEAAAPPNVQEADVFFDTPDEHRRNRGSAPKPSVHASEFVMHEVERIRREVVFRPNQQDQEEKAAPLGLQLM